MCGRCEGLRHAPDFAPRLAHGLLLLPVQHGELLPQCKCMRAQELGTSWSYLLPGREEQDMSKFLWMPLGWGKFWTIKWMQHIPINRRRHLFTWSGSIGQGKVEREEFLRPIDDPSLQQFMAAHAVIVRVESFNGPEQLDVRMFCFLPRAPLWAPPLWFNWIEAL